MCGLRPGSPFAQRARGCVSRLGLLAVAARGLHRLQRGSIDFEARFPTGRATMPFDLASCVAAGNSGGIDAWIARYLSVAPWANEGLRRGLRLQRRFWLGPLRMSLSRLVRCCGPEPAMEYIVPAKDWDRWIAGLAARLGDCADVPPWIVEWRSGTRAYAMATVAPQPC